MGSLNSVEINKIKVTPLSEWNYLLKQTPPVKCAWPQTSALLCWECCHSFANVPAYLPIKAELDVANRQGKFVFTGNFCSWNCVKRYAMRLEVHKKQPKGCFYIGLLAYLTVCKRIVCDDENMHDLGLCDCVDKYRGVTLPLGRETLASFGGKLTIEEYRRDFHVISDYSAIQRNFSDVLDVVRLHDKARKSKNVKFWGFHYLHYAGPDASYTTFVNILPLTNRTFDKRTLVTTGNEISGADTHKLTTAEEPKPVPDAPRPKKPRAQHLTTRRSKPSQPAAFSSLIAPAPHHHDSNDNNDSDTTIGQARGPFEHTFKAASGPPMTKEQVLACNDEQQFYTNCLRGYGNILTSMGIKISKPE